MHKKLSIAFIIVAIILMVAGGIADAKGKEGVKVPGMDYSVSKYHLWADGAFAGILAIWLLCICKHKV